MPQSQDLGGEGQMRLSDTGEVIDPAAEAEIVGADTPENADFPALED